MAPAFASGSALKPLEQRLRQCLAAAPGGDMAGLFSLTLRVPALDVFDHLPELEPPYFFWSQPSRGHYRLGLGRVLVLESEAEARFEQLSQQLESLRTRWHHHDPDGLDTQPGCYTAFAFEPGRSMHGPWEGLPNSLIYIPEVEILRRNGQAAITFTCRAEELAGRETLLQRWLRRCGELFTAMAQQPTAAACQKVLQAEDLPATRDWQRLVGRTTSAIRAGQLAKVVLARSVRIRTASPFRVSDTVAALARRYPDCQVVSINLDGTTVIAATPERLLALEQGRVTCDALGGTTGSAADTQRTRQLAEHLLHDPKARHEHALVVDAIHRALHPFCEQLNRPDSPRVIQLRSLQHLWTELGGQLRPGVNLLQVAAALHPTPAVAGTPTPGARRWIATHEPLERGWYTGSVGWLTGNDAGELAVLLRCAVLRQDQAVLFAGAGIVAESDPQAELAETELKLEAMLQALVPQEPAFQTAALCQNG